MKKKMPSTQTKRSRSRGTQSCSTPQTCNPSQSHISKYFAKPTEDLSDSPYKDCLKAQNDAADKSGSDLDDFKTPKALNKVPKIQKKAAKATKRRKTSRQPSLRNFVEANLKHSDVNPDHLQMALALSESSYMAETGEAPSSQVKTENFRKAFEKYGFGYSKSKIPVEHKRELAEKRTNKKSKFRYVTPTLKLRTDEERQALISGKISLILAQQKRYSNCSTQSLDLFSEKLKDFADLKIFPLNNLEQGELNTEKFYVSSLGLETSSGSCALLLKDWRRIPGREATPEPRKTNHMNTPTEQCSPHEPVSTNQEAASNGSPIRAQDLVDDDVSPIKQSEEATNQIMGTPNLIRSFVGEVETNEVISTNHETVSDGSPRIAGSEATPQLGGTNQIIKTSAPLHSSLRILEKAEANEQNMSPIKVLAENSILISDEETELYDLNVSGIEQHTPIEESFPRLSACFDRVSGGKYTTPQGVKRSSDCLSPDLFESEDDKSPHVSQPKGGNKQVIDLTHSDSEESRHEDQKSGLNVTDYVLNLLNKPDKLERISSEDSLSQNSICISDEELNYSCVLASSPQQKVEYNFSDDEELYKLPLAERIKQKASTKQPNCENNATPKTSPSMNVNTACQSSKTHKKSPVAKATLEDSTSSNVNTPSNGDFIIKTKNVTPMADYDAMDTPKVLKELDQFGLKPLKRQKGVKLLKYIYESTHPQVQDENGKVIKKRRISVSQVGDLADGEVILEKKQSKRVHSCAVPLHIVWHNFVMSNPKIRENILLYEPLQIEVILSMIKEQGYKFNLQDLLGYLDKKCITVRVAQGQRKRH